MNIKNMEEQLVAKYHKYNTEDDSIKRLYEFTTTEISDALDGNNVMENGIKPIAQNTKMIGRALTVKLPFEESLLTNKAIDIAKPGDILVINTSNTKNKAAWGDVKTIKAMKKNIGGIVVDGAIRDVTRNRELDFPMFTKYIVPSASNKDGGGELNITILCGEVQVNPRDIVFGDDNGVVVIPLEKLDEVIKKASEKLENDKEKTREILSE